MPDAVRPDPDRLPWLTDPAPAQTQRVSGNLAALSGWAVAVVLAVAGASYWLGTQSGDQRATKRAQPMASAPAATLQLPDPQAQPQVEIGAPPEVRPAPVPVVAVPEPAVEKRQPARSSPQTRATPARSAPIASGAAPVSARPKPLTLWPSRQVKGAKGRLVQIGAFGSREQAKQGWRQMQRSYPAVGRLPAVVVETRNSRGRKFFRFQIGTTSQAHSEVLCQRMQKIRFSCAVLGLPWKAKVER